MIENIEIAILKQLNDSFGGEKPALGYKIEKIDSYKAELSDFGTLIKNKRTAALVACGGISLNNDYPEGNEYNISILIYLYSRNSKLNERSTRFGGTGSVGLYRMLTDVIRLLNRNDLGILSSELVLDDAHPIFDNKVNNFNAACWELEFKGVFTDHFAAYPGMNKPDLLKTIAADWIVSGAKSKTVVKFDHESEESDAE